MKKTIFTIAIFSLLMVSPAFAGDIIGNHGLSSSQGLVRVKSVVGNRMAHSISSFTLP